MSCQSLWTGAEVDSGFVEVVAAVEAAAVAVVGMKVAAGTRTAVAAIL